MTILAEFYIVPEDVFRLGNADSSRLSNVRPRDVDTMAVNGIVVVIETGRASAFSTEKE